MTPTSPHDGDAVSGDASSSGPASRPDDSQGSSPDAGASPTSDGLARLGIAIARLGSALSNVDDDRIDLAHILQTRLPDDLRRREIVFDTRPIDLPDEPADLVRAAIDLARFAARAGPPDGRIVLAVDQDPAGLRLFAGTDERALPPPRLRDAVHDSPGLERVRRIVEARDGELFPDVHGGATGITVALPW